MGTIDTRQSNSTTSYSGGNGLTRRTGGERLDYTDVDRVGFDKLPVEIREAVSGRKIMLGGVICADAENPVAKRRSDGSYYQEMKAWWVGAGSYVDIRAVRELVQAGDGRLRPNGPWSAASIVYTLPPGVRAMHSVWRSAESSGSGSKQDTGTLTDDALDILPPQVAAPVAGGLSDAWLEWGKGFAHEVVVALRPLDGRIRALRAERSGRSRKMLPNCDWHIDTVDAPIIGKRLAAVGSPPASLLKAMERSMQQVSIVGRPSDKNAVGRSPSAPIK